MLSDHRYGLASSASNVLGGQRMSKSAPCSPIKPLIKRAPARADSFHVIHKVPVGDSPYVRAKHVQLVDKDPERAIALFWAAINAGDRVDSALKDMAIVMKQQNRPEEAIEAIKSLRSRCSEQSQESLDNVLLDLYKRCGRLDDQIALLKHKLHLIHQGLAFNGKRTKTARSQGKKFQVSIEQEATRLLGNLGWAYMQQSNYAAAEAVYRKALSIEPDNNKVCNLGICLMKQGRLEEAKLMLQSVTPASTDSRWGSDSHLKSYERAQEMLRELENSTGSAAMELGPRASGFGGTEHTQNNNASNIYLQTAGFGPSSDGVFNRPFHPNGAESFCDQIKQQKLAQFMPGYVDSWEDDDSEILSADENQHINLQGGSAVQQASSQQMKMHAEMLRQKLESISKMAGMGNGKLLNSAAPPFTLNSSNLGPKQGLEDRNKGFEFKVPAPKCMNNFSRSENNGNVHANGNGNGNGNVLAWNRVSGMGGDENSKRPTRRSLSMESFESSFNPVVVPPSNCGNAGLPPRISKTPPKIPNREKALLPSLSSWGELGFISSPRALDFTCVDSVVGNVVPEVQSAAAALESISMTESPKPVLSSIEQEMKCQRRLRVFQEITLA